MNSWIEITLLIIAQILMFFKLAFISQKEHYIPWSVTKTLIRWVKIKPVNLILVLGLILGTVSSIILQDKISWAVVAFSILFLPFGTYRWYTKLAITNRTKRLFLIYALLSIVSYLILLYIVNPVAAFVIPMSFSFVILDKSAWFVTPLEKKLQNKFVTQAKSKLKKVNPRIVAITGSYGKTSTKVYVKTLIGKNRTVCASAASFNNLMGLSRAVNETLMPNTDIFVAEMGTYGIGEIAKLCEWVQPEVAVMTAIGPMHLERMKSLENILKAKSEITKDAKVVVINISDKMLKTFVAENPEINFFTVGDENSDASLKYRQVAGNKYEFTYENIQNSPTTTKSGTAEVPKTAHLTNVACAFAVALYFEVDFDEILSRIPKLFSPDHRRTIETAPNGQIIIDDTFNLNPAGAAEDLLLMKEKAPQGGKKVVVTPGMVELGKIQYEENEKFGVAIAELADMLVIVGHTNRLALLDGVSKRIGSGTEVAQFKTREEAVKYVMNNTKEGDVVLYANDIPVHYP